ncbi:hypothetical protein K458DRAFT_110115 [Lentithecium fluviatile CBS 122367]|uniref:Uncharacterized protein n=1 Tax=Lentithecium fluviatile CBS 122367 TaxID=1168545 RepID=A0A6G1IPV4_9PLEO|nr:hypothetical protein K458DRAFT_110115 [Lentithecium fluviatile CBS 122367]
MSIRSIFRCFFTASHPSRARDCHLATPALPPRTACYAQSSSFPCVAGRLRLGNPSCHFSPHYPRNHAVKPFNRQSNKRNRPASNQSDAVHHPCSRPLLRLTTNVRKCPASQASIVMSPLANVSRVCVGFTAKACLLHSHWPTVWRRFAGPQGWVS